MKVLKNRIQIVRRQRLLTQNQLADLLNTRPRSIRRWESGESIPTVDIVMNMIEVLDCSLNDLYYFDEV